jgi:hypothetical protein
MAKEEVPKKTNPSEEPMFYWENGYMVFTEAYHRKRGHCCNSGCRHCPYEIKKDGEAGASKSIL